MQVRYVSGVPTVADFKGSKGTPLVVCRVSGKLYVLKVGDVVYEVPTGGASGPVSWADVTGKPSTFPAEPHLHNYEAAGAVVTHAAADDPHPVYLTAAEANAAFAALAHLHSIANVAGLQTALDGKQASGSYQVTTEKGSANGYAGLDATGRVPVAQLPALGGLSGAAALPATTGTMTANMATARVLTITPTGACTFNASGGTAGHEVSFAISTSGTVSFVMTWGTNFRKAGTLSTGTVSARHFSVTFVCVNGTIWQEIGRTAAQT
jgi:hypothetical protein